MQHIIRKQVIQLEMDKSLDGFDVQHRVSLYYQKEIVPLLERLLNELSIEDETVQLDTVEIDLGIFSINDITQPNWIDEIRSKILQQLRLVVHKGLPQKERIIQAESLNICSQWLFYMQ